MIRPGVLGSRLVLSMTLCAALAWPAGAAADGPITTFGVISGYLEGLAGDAQGGAYVATRDGVFRYAADLSPLGRLVGGEASDVAVDPQGDLYVTSNGGHTLAKYPPSGGQSLWFRGLGSQEPSAVTLDGPGNPWVADANGRLITEYSAADGSEITHWTAGDSQGGPIDLAFLPDGTLWVAMFGEPGSLAHYTASGTLIGSVASGLPWHPFGVATTGTGDLFLAGSSRAGGSVVERLDPAGRVISTYDIPASPGTSGPAVANGLTASGSSLLYVGVTEYTSPWEWSNHLIRFDLAQPQALLAALPGPVLTGANVALDASRSWVPFASPTRFEWDLDGNGTFERDTGATPTVTTSYDTRGVRTVSVRVTAPSGRTSTAGIPVDVRPTPPAGPVGISIDDGAAYTNDPAVSVRVVWPLNALTVTLSNDGGFAGARAVAVDSPLAWTLVSTGSERQPKLVYARFDGATQTFHDDIILDQTPPRILAATVAPAATARATAARARAWRVTISARDRNSGVRRTQIARDRRHPSRLMRYRHVTKVRGAEPRWVRVRDGAGNLSRWRRLR